MINEKTFKIIADSINKLNRRKIIWSLTKHDLLFLFIFISISSIIWIPLLATINLIPFLITLSISLLVAFIFVSKFNLDTKLYQIIFRWIKYKFKNKKINLNIIKETNENIIYFTNDKRYKVFRIIGSDTTFVSDHDFDNLSIKLANFLNTFPKLFLLKIDSSINLESQLSYLNSLIKKDTFHEAKKEIEAFKNYIIDLDSKQQTKTTNKYFLICEYSIDEDNINQYLSLAKIFVKLPTISEMNEIKEKLFFDNQEYIEKPNYFFSKKENNFVSFLAIKKLPIKVYREWLVNIFNRVDVSISLNISTWDKIDAIKKIDNILLLAYEKQLVQNSKNSDMLTNLLTEESFNEILKSIEINDDQLKSLSLILKIESNSKRDLVKKIHSLQKELLNQQIVTDRLLFLQEVGLKTFINSSSQIEKNKAILNLDVLSSSLAFGYPFINQELIDTNGLILGLDDNQTPITIDWKLRSKSKISSSTILLGQTGSGKTTTTKRIIKNQIIAEQYKIFIIDPENEYSTLIKQFDGQIINLNSNDFVINPFYLFTSKDNSNLNDLINNKILFLSTFLNLVFGNVLMRNDINDIISVCFDLYKKNKMVEWTFSDLKKAAIKNKLKSNIIDCINLYCKNSAYGNLFDHKNKINIHSDFIDFEFKEIISRSSKEIAKAQIFLVLQFLNEFVLENNFDSKYINIILDEAHLLLDEKYIEIAQYLCEMFKRIRKYNGMMTIATQNISDFYSKKEIIPYTLPIMNNSFYIIAHSIKPQEIDDLNNLMKEIGGLNDKERKYLIDATSGSAILFFKNVRTKIRVNA